MASLQSLLVFLFALTIAAQLFFSVFSGDALMNTCHVARNSPAIRAKVKSQAVSSGNLTLLMNTISLVCVVAASVSVSRVEWRLRISFNNVYSLLCQVLWFISSYHFASFLKEALADDRCSSHGNSISGHFLYHLMLLISVPFHVVRTRRNPNQLSHYMSKSLLGKFFKGKLRLLTYFCCFCFLAVAAIAYIVLYRTYYLGYHTMKQVFYGVELALFLELIFTSLFSNHKLDYWRWYIQFIAVSFFALFTNIIAAIWNLRMSVYSLTAKLLLYILITGILEMM